MPLDVLPVVHPGALELLNEPAKPVHGANPLVQIESSQKLEETNA